MTNGHVRDAMNQGRRQSLQELQQTIRSCTRCVGAGFIPVANPVFRGHADLRHMIVGQAPGPRAHEVGPPWSGASGTLLRNWLARAGFDPERFLDDWYFTSVTRCFPGKAASGPGDRAPSAAERTLCRPHLDAEIALVQPRLIVTLGRMAAGALIPAAKSLTLRQLVGAVYEVDFASGSIPVVPLPHPSGVGRWLNDPGNRALVDQALLALVH